jgi:hypothetical protein
MTSSTRASASGPDGRDAAAAGPRHWLLNRRKDTFAEGQSQRDSRERAAARPYQIGKRGWMGFASQRFGGGGNTGQEFPRVRK